MTVMDLDDVERLSALDLRGALAETGRYGDQFREGLKICADGAEAFGRLEALRADRQVSSVLILGTGGGSALSANLLKALAFQHGHVPIVLHQGYGTPGFVNENTLVIAVSHSGNTEEILAAYAGTIAKGAAGLAITSGGRLQAAAEQAGHPVLHVPGGMMPRIALGIIFVPLLYTLEVLGLVGDGIRVERVVEDACKAFDDGAKEYGLQSPTAINPAKALAVKLAGYTPVIYGLSEFTDAIADRWKRQFGENSKRMAFANAIPHLHHDEAVGWDDEGAALRRFYFLLLSDPDAGTKLEKRLQVSLDILAERAGGVMQLAGRGPNAVARMFSLLQMGDYVTLYAALHRGIDPTPVAVIDLFKRKMAE